MKNLSLLLILSLSVLLAGAQTNLDDNTNSENNVVAIDNYINVSLYPNPSRGQFYIKMDDETPYDVTIYAMNGAIVFNQKNIQERTHVIELESSMAKGFYNVALRQGNNSIIKKLIVR